MPTYEYRCEECGITFERFQKFSDEPVKICPECNGPVRRVIYPVGIVFNGSGFYVTDHRSESSSSSARSAKKEGKDADKHSEGKLKSPESSDSSSKN